MPNDTLSRDAAGDGCAFTLQQQQVLVERARRYAKMWGRTAPQSTWDDNESDALFVVAKLMRRYDYEHAFAVLEKACRFAFIERLRVATGQRTVGGAHDYPLSLDEILTNPDDDSEWGWVPSALVHDGRHDGMLLAAEALRVAPENRRRDVVLQAMGYTSTEAGRIRQGSTLAQYKRMAEMRARLRGSVNGAPLSQRETEVLQHAADGAGSSVEIGKRMFLSAETVKSHRKNVIAKLKATEWTHAVAIAMREGLIR